MVAVTRPLSTRGSRTVEMLARTASKLGKASNDSDAVYRSELLL
jgi:hypothetical protein